MDELTKLLSQMGADGNENGKESLKGHAERLWKFLDNLAESDPEEYQNFLKVKRNRFFFLSLEK